MTPAGSYSDKPIRVMVGAMVSGPMNRMTKPIRPEKPTTIWKREATMIDPCSCGQKQKQGNEQKVILCLNDVTVTTTGYVLEQKTL